MLQAEYNFAVTSFSSHWGVCQLSAVQTNDTKSQDKKNAQWQEELHSRSRELNCQEHTCSSKFNMGLPFVLDRGTTQYSNVQVDKNSLPIFGSRQSKLIFFFLAMKLQFRVILQTIREICTFVIPLC